MGQCRLSIASPALLVSAVHESTSEQRGNNKLAVWHHNVMVMEVDRGWRYVICCDTNLQYALSGA